jgi:hypothetical protein
MSISHVNTGSQLTSAQSRNDIRQRQQWREQQVGDRIDVRIAKQIDQRHFLVSFGAEQHLVESAMQLPVGARIRAMVVAVGDKLELKYVETLPASDAAASAQVATQSTRSAGSAGLEELERRHAVVLTDAQRHLVQSLANGAASERLLMQSGLYLSKLSMPLNAESLSALHDIQAWPQKSEQQDQQMHAALPLAGDDAVAALSGLMRQAVDDDISASHAATNDAQPLTPDEELSLRSATNDSSADSHEQLARDLLNFSDEHGRNHSFGSLPVLIDNQLVELDLVYFRNRAADPGRSNVRRLVMSFQSQTLGRVEIVAQSLADRLSIVLCSDSPVGSELLAEHAEQVRDLARRLGWNVDSLQYTAKAEPARAAQHVVDHVLSTDVLDRWI